MKKSIIGLLVFMGMGISANAANKDEWWEYSMQMDGMGGINMPAQKDCYRKDNIAPSGGGDDCSQSNVKQTGNKFSADFSCKDGTTGRMEGSSSGNDSTFKMTSKSANGEIMTMTSKGKKVGSCNWETDSSEAKACAMMNQSVTTAKVDNKKLCEDAIKNDDFQAFLGNEGSSDASANMAGKTCGGKITTGCVEQRPKMCSKMQILLKDNSGYSNGFKKVMDDKAGAELVKKCNIDTTPATKQFCTSKMKEAKSYQGDIVKFCEVDAKALYAQHCAGRDYTAQKDSGYGGICSAYGKGGSTPGQDSGASNDSSSSGGDASKGTNPIDGAVKGVKKLKDVFGF